VQPYNIYIEADARYADLTDGFVIGQSWMNLVEVALNYVTLAIVDAHLSLACIPQPQLLESCVELVLRGLENQLPQQR